MQRQLSLIRSVLFLLALSATIVHADEIPVRGVQLTPIEEGGYALSAGFELELSERLETALGKGVPLYFILEFECLRPRWYWFDKTISNKRLEMKLDFHALTRSYRISNGSQRQSFASASEALRALGTVRDWQVLTANDLEPLSVYEVGVRLSLDVNQLPKPFQVSALTNNDWTLASEWQRWAFTTGPNRKIVQ
ncbi:MAG TPA: DUF4390 domain-containing protein [Burkholderiales bacterium]|nr:DUF4390 domain-containing protein [Burkholderiales bacterium]